MNIHKLSAINSTNDYLKELYTKVDLENFTVVSADFQTKGKGQVVSKWNSENGKNLLFSVLLKFDNFDIQDSAFLNFAVSNSIYYVLKTYLPSIKIKWPNDIMAGNKKICGILIENSVKNKKINHSVVGIGLNVNQLIFPNLPQATSLKILLDKNIDKDFLLKELIIALKDEIYYLENKKLSYLKKTYQDSLFKINIPSMFKSKNNNVFMGKIIGVSKTGLLQVEMESGIVREYANKEIGFM